jgi:annexin D
MVEEDAKLLYKSGEKRIGTDEKTFIRIFSERSSTHLAAVNSAYTSFGKSLEKVMCIQVSSSDLFNFRLYYLE